MAAQGAHLTSTTADEGEKPSVFEVLAEESLVHALRPALQHLLRILAENNPSRYGRWYVYSEEVYLLLQLILDHYYLKHYSASFSENFYGMKRTLPSEVHSQSSTDGGEGEIDSGVSSDRLGPSDPDTPHTGSTLYKSLPRSHRMRSLVCLALFPYLKSKCDKWYEKLKENAQTQTSPSKNQPVVSRLCSAFLAVYPVLHSLWEAACLVYTVRYALGRASVHSPLLRWAGVVLHNLTQDDMVAGTTGSRRTLSEMSWREAASTVPLRALSLVAVTLSSGLSVGVFFLQFLEWWYASDQRTATLTALPVPDAPKVSPHPRVPRLPTLCPLCQRVRTNDTALAVSGYVFCYSCISAHIRENACCPVTRYPATSDHLIRIYTPGS